MTDKVVLPKICDMHVHFREDEMLHKVMKHTIPYCSHALVMPNLKEPITRAADVKWYREILQTEAEQVSESNNFTAHITIAIQDNTEVHHVAGAYQENIIAVKIYPRGVTTNSKYGLGDFFSPNMLKVLGYCEDVGIPVSLHGETDLPGVLITEREEAFLPTLRKLHKMFPRLKIILEHVTTRMGVDTVLELGDTVVATVTIHHMLLTLNDVIGKPHNVCAPIAKSFEDCDAVRAFATSGHKKCMFGSDSAPHPRHKKECALPAFGIFSAPVVPELLVQIFAEENALIKLGAFTSENAKRFYGIKDTFPQETITLTRQDWVVPDEYDGIVPFMAGETLKWKRV